MRGFCNFPYPEFEKRKVEVHKALSGITKSIAALRKIGLEPEIVTSGRNWNVQHYSGIRGSDRDSAGLLRYDGPRVQQDGNLRHRFPKLSDSSLHSREHL